MDNSLLSLIDNSENTTNINNNDDRILNSIIFRIKYITVY